MIHEATGKFSSRWVLPDRRSLAVVIGIDCIVEHGRPRARFEQRHTGPLAGTPYMGNSRAKPMLSRDFRKAPGAPGTDPSRPGKRVQLSASRIIDRGWSAPRCRVSSASDDFAEGTPE